MLPDVYLVFWHFLAIFESTSLVTLNFLEIALSSRLIFVFLDKIAHFTDFDEVANKKSSLDPESHKNLEKKRESVLVTFI